jgi:hypothetical protein
VVPIEWRAATHAPLFPVFAGYLRLTARHLELDGQYLPPGGTVGYVVDRLLLHVAASGTRTGVSSFRRSRGRLARTAGTTSRRQTATRA